MPIRRLVAILLIHLGFIVGVGILVEARGEPVLRSRYDGGSRYRALPGAVRVIARLIDAETHRPVPRTSLWIHGFNDALDAQASLEPGVDLASFELWLPAPELRLRIVDKTDEYVLFEQRFVADGPRLDLEIALQPTHWIRLHGRVLWDDGGTLRPVGYEGNPVVGPPMISIGRAGGVHSDDDGRFSIRVPREELETDVISSRLRVHPRRLDLRGATEAERALDLVLRDD